MQLLDAILAFALTMAALATVVTIIMEACLRISRMRKKNLIEVMKLLNRELGKGALGMNDNERWEFFVRVVENPAEATIGKLKSEWVNLPLEKRIAFFGRDKAAGTTINKRIYNFVLQLFGDKKRAGIYEKASLEYMLRCLSETVSIQNASKEFRETLRVEFNRIARKYEEFGSSVSASFKHHAQAWSIGVGVILAILANVDGMRIFEAYRVDPNLTAAVIEKQGDFTQSFESAQKVVEEINKAQNELEVAKEELTKAENEKDKNKITNSKLKLVKAETSLENLLALNNIKQSAQHAQQQLADLVAIGVPLGWDLYPCCPYDGTPEEWSMSSPKCKDISNDKRKKIVKFDLLDASILNTALNDFPGFALWLLKVVITGILIGLGAPFWFDVAKRISQIRKGIQSTSASAEYRLSARDANGNYKKRKEIVEHVLADTFEEAKIKNIENLEKEDSA